MHNAPSVMFPVGRCVWYGVALVILAVAGACALAAWFWLDGRHGVMPWPGLAGAALWLAWIALAARAWRQAPTGQLRWRALERGDSESGRGTWHWHSVAHPEGLALRSAQRMLDLQRLVLLRLCRADAPALWVWVEQARDPVRWNVLRRALVSSDA